MKIKTHLSMCSPKVDLGWWGGSGGIGIRDGRQFRFKLKRCHIETISYSGGNSSALAAANCDPDYGWINGPQDSNKCYMYLKVRPDFLVVVLSGNQSQLVKFFEIRTPPIQRAFRTAEVDILTTVVIRQDFVFCRWQFLEIITIVAKQDFDFFFKNCWKLFLL